MADTPKIAVIGGGSWATAIVKMLLNNVEEVNWWLRDEGNIEHITKYGHNRNYLPSILLDVDKLNVSSDIQSCIENAEIIVFAVPSAFLKESLSPCSKDSFKGKVVTLTARIVSRTHGNVGFGKVSPHSAIRLGRNNLTPR